MRIGILTLPLHTNYGGILQAYALQTILEKLGHQVIVLDTSQKHKIPAIWKFPFCLIKRIVLKLTGKQKIIFVERYWNHQRKVITQNITPFIMKYIHRKEILSFSELNENDYDAFVVGSDQVWRTLYFCPMWHGQTIDNAYLSFAKEWNIKRVAYAASFGTDYWEYSTGETSECKECVEKFDAVSTREDCGVQLCKKYFDVEAKCVLDPTMLLSSKDYISLIEQSKTPKSKGSLLVYVLDETENSKSIVAEISKIKHLVPFSVNNPYEYNEQKPLKKRIKISVETWLRGFYDAEFIITDSFHACVFSILFQKQFVVIGNKSRGLARIESLFKRLGIENRFVEENKGVKAMENIDYNKVFQRYDELKKESLAFLKENLDK